MRSRKLKKVLSIFLVGVLGILILLFASLNLNFSQRFITGRVNQVLEKVNVPIHITSIQKILPGSVNVHGVTITDLKNDTIIYTGEVSADIRLLALLRSKVVLKNVDLNHADVKILMNYDTRKLNIAEAFTANKNPNKEKGASSWEISIKKGNLISINFQMEDSISGIHILQDISRIGIKRFSILLAERELGAHTLELSTLKGIVTINPSRPNKKSKSAQPWNFGLSELSMNGIDFTYLQESDSIMLSMILGEGIIRINEMNLPDKVIDIEKISLERSTTNLLIGNGPLQPVGSSKNTSGDFLWDLKCKEIGFDDINIWPGAGVGLTKLDMKLKGIRLNNRQAGVKINGLSLNLDNGFSLKRMKGELDSNRGTTKLNLEVETANSLLNLDGNADMNLVEMISVPGEIGEAKIAINKTSFSLQDILSFVPALQDNLYFMAMAKRPFSIAGEIGMSNSTLRIPELSITQDRNFKIALEGTAENPFQFTESKGDLKLSLSEIDMTWLKMMFTEIGMEDGVPDFEEFALEGTVSDSFSAPDISLLIQSNLGNMDLSGGLKFGTGGFWLNTDFNRVMLGELLANPDLGSLTGSVEVAGSGFTHEILKADLLMQVDSLRYNDYDYTSIGIEAMIQPNEYEFHLLADDPSLQGSLNAVLNRSDTTFMAEASGYIFARLNELHFFNDTLAVESRITANLLKQANSLESDLSISSIGLTTPQEVAVIPQISAFFRTDSVMTMISGESDFFNVDFELGKTFSEIGTLGDNFKDYLASFLDPQLENAAVRVSVLPEIKATSSITNHEALGMFVQDTGFHISTLDFSIIHRPHENRINCYLNGRGINYKMIKAEAVNASLTDSAGMMSLELISDSSSLFTGPEYRWMLNADFAELSSVTTLSIQDPLDQLIYNLEIHTQVDSNQIVLRAPSQQFILNQALWNLETPDLLTYNLSNKLVSPSLRMHTDSSFMHLNSLYEKESLTYKVEMDKVKFASLLLNDLLPGSPDGSISGSIGYSLMGDEGKKITSDLQVSDVKFSDLRFSDMECNGFVVIGNTGNYSIDMFARLDSSRFNLKGEKTENQDRNLKAELLHVPLNTLQPFTKEYLSDLGGFISGDFSIATSEGTEQLDGALSFSDVGLRINTLNSSFRINDQRVTFADEKIIFNNFRVADTLDKELLVDGFIDYSNRKSVTTDLKISSSDLQVMNRSEEEKASLYGNIFVDSRILMTGPLANPTIDGKVILSKGTEVYYHHLEDLSLSESEKIVRFTTHPAYGIQERGPSRERQNTFVQSTLKTIVEIDPNTVINFNLSKRIYNIVLRIKGGGTINYNMLNRSQIILSGKYEISEGDADLKLVGWPNKSFRITSGGFIRWDGRIEDPELQFEAVNKVATSYTNPVDGNQRNVDFFVTLQLSNHLSDLDILFTINTPDQYLMSIINTLGPEEQMRQAITILLFEIIDLPGISSSTDYMTQQVNQILAAQLNQLTETSIQGIDISFGLDSYSQPKGAGGEDINTSLSYEVRKSLLDDRAQIELSGRFNDANQQPGESDMSLNNISFEYRLDSAATKYLKVYNEHTYDDVFEGEVIKTGVGITYRKRYRYLKDIWKREEKNKKTRNKEK